MLKRRCYHFLRLQF